MELEHEIRDEFDRVWPDEETEGAEAELRRAVAIEAPPEDALANVVFPMLQAQRQAILRLAREIEQIS
jgi:hypothetical protein